MKMAIQKQSQRAECAYQSENSRFLLDCDFSKQYFNYYRVRMQKYKSILEFNCRSKWGDSVPILTVSDLAACEDNQSQKCIITGIIYKRMKLQPNVIDELSSGSYNISCERYAGHYTSSEDTLVLEGMDESIKLSGNIDTSKFVTGPVVAVMGTLTHDASEFCVQDICFCEPNYQSLYADLKGIERPLPSNQEPMYLMVVSGLGFGPEMDSTSKHTVALQDLIDFVWGAGKFADDDRCGQIARILVAGDSLSESRHKSEQELNDGDDLAAKMKLSRQVKPAHDSIQAVKYMDDFFTQLSKTIHVEVMPGPSDPSSHIMPQQPFHPCMFPKSCAISTFNCVTNPHHAFYDDVEVLATSGQNIDIIKMFSDLKEPFDIMKCHLKWGNCAPSAPDNLYTAPYEEDDPFVIDFIPDIYIAGCQDSYRVDYYHYNSCSTPSTHLNGSTNIITNGTKSITTNGTIHKTTNGTTNGIYTNGISHSQESTSSLSQSSGSSDLKLHRKKQTVLVTVPKFYETHSCVLINLRTFSSELLKL